MRVKTHYPTVPSLLLLALAMTAVAKSHKASEFPTIKIDNFGCINANFYRGAQPERGDYKALAELGVKTIIDLRDDWRKEAKGLVEASGMKYVLIAMDDRGKPTEAQIQEFMKTANDPANQPVFVHCKGGRHRTGLVTAIYRMENDGWTAEQAYDEMKEFDFSYGYGHGDLKTYVFDYQVKKEHAITGTSTSIDSSKQ
jgi:protein tyrosine/serine phosphatase